MIYHIKMIQIRHLDIWSMGNNQAGGVKDILFWNRPGFFRFLTLSLGILDKLKLHPFKFHKIVLHPLEILRPTTRTPGNSTWIFLDHPWKFQVVYNWPLENPLAIYSIPLEIPYHQPPLFFCWNSAMLLSGQVPHTSNSSHLFWNLKDPVLVQTLSYGRNNLPPMIYCFFFFFIKWFQCRILGMCCI